MKPSALTAHDSRPRAESSRVVTFLRSVCPMLSQNGGGGTGWGDVNYIDMGMRAFGDPVTPLPAALPLFATGLGGLGLLGWRRKRKAQSV